MVSVEHTPGPWSVTPRGEVVADHPIEGAGPGHNDPTYYGGKCLIAESIYRLADRRLIAAGPDLLASCLAALPSLKAAWQAQTDGPDLWPLVEQLRSAIAKATGEGV